MSEATEVATMEAPATTPATENATPESVPVKKSPPKPKKKRAPTVKDAVKIVAKIKKAKAKAAEKAANPAAKKGKKDKLTPRAPREHKEGLRKPQFRILSALSKVSRPLDKFQIQTKAEIQPNWVKDYLGRIDPAERPAHDKLKGYPSLLTQGFVRVEEHDIKGKDVHVYTITAKGKAALDKHNSNGKPKTK